MSDPTLRIPVEVLPQLRLAALGHLADAANDLVGLIREAEGSTDIDPGECYARLSMLSGEVAMRCILLSEAGWPTEPISDLLIEDPRGSETALQALVYQCGRLTTRLLDPGGSQSSREQIAEGVKRLTQFLHASGVDMSEICDAGKTRARRLDPGENQ